MILLDTCVISEMLRPEPSPNVSDWLESLPEEQVYLPALVIGELEKGVELQQDGATRSALRIWLEQLRHRFSGRIVDFDEQTALQWGGLTARCRKTGRKLPVIDSILAAGALQHAAVLATRNVQDFEGTGIEILNPWDYR